MPKKINPARDSQNTIASALFAKSVILLEFFGLKSNLVGNYPKPPYSHHLVAYAYLFTDLALSADAT